MRNPPNIPHELYIDLSEIEGNPMAFLLVAKTEEYPSAFGLEPPPGIVLSADRGAHGADLHLSWSHVREVRDTLSRLLREAGEE